MGSRDNAPKTEGEIKPQLHPDYEEQDFPDYVPQLHPED